MTDLAYLSAADALAAFRARQLSPVELVGAVIERAQQVEPQVNALADRFFGSALEAARAAEQRYAGKGEPPRPLEGIPVAIKEETPVAGQPWTQGSLIFKDLVADFSAPIAERLLAAGAVVHARATAPEFSCVPWTHSRLHGVTRNPWNPGYAVGGSSGGSAAALAAGETTLASGSDIGGSIRIPAAFCGVVGFKPPYGRVPSWPPFNLDYYNHDGPMARTVTDCLLFENVIAGPHPLDIASISPKVELASPTGDIDGWRVAVSPSLGGFAVDDQVVANTMAAAAALREAGAVVEEAEPGWAAADVKAAAVSHFRAAFIPSLAAEIEQHCDLLCSYVFDWLSVFGGEADIVAGMQLENRLMAYLSALFADFRVLLCPTIGVTGYEAGKDYLVDQPKVNGTPIGNMFDCMTTVPFNMFSRCPVMSVPSGFAENGVPTGMQIVGRPFDDQSVFEVAAAYERLRPWLDTPERRPRLAAETGPAEPRA